MKIKFACVIFAVALCSLTFAAPTDSITQVVKTKLLETSASWDGALIKEYPKGKPKFTVLEIKIPPNTALEEHIHPMPNVAYVKLGKITVVRTSDKLSKTFSAGEALEEMVNTPHYGYTGSEGAILIVLYAGVDGQELAIPVKK